MSSLLIARSSRTYPRNVVPLIRKLASISSTPPPNPNSVGPFQVFDREAKRIQKDRAASRDNGERSRTVDYVRESVADSMMERLLVSTNIFEVQNPLLERPCVGHQKKV